MKKAVSLLMLMMSGTAHAQGTRADYERAAALQKATEGKVLRANVRPHWFEDGRKFWYRNDLADGAREFIVVDAGRGTRDLAFDHARVAQALLQLTGGKISAGRLPVERLKFTATGVILQGRDKAWTLDLATYAIAPYDGPLDTLPSLPAGERITASETTGPETHLNFVNRTNAPVELVWVTFDNGRQTFGTIAPGATYRQHTFEGHVWIARQDGKILGIYRADGNRDTVLIEERKGDAPSRAARPDANLSPDGHWRAFFRNNNLWLRDIVAGQESALTADGKPENFYEGPLLWSPDSSRLVAQRTLAGQEHKVFFVESSPPDQLQPKLHSMDYLKPGDRIPLTKPQLFDVPNRVAIPIADTLFPNPWSVGDFHWRPDSSEFFFVYNQRGHQVLRVVAVNAVSGAARVVVDEQSKTFIDYAGKKFVGYLDADNAILWMSERDGWNHLYLFDAGTGALKKQLTRGPWVVRGVEEVDEEKREILLRAGGLVPGEDPYFQHFARVDFDGKLTRLTDGDGTHEVSFSPDGKYFVDKWSRVDLTPVSGMRRSADGSLVCDLERADWKPLLATGWRAPERFLAKARDGVTDIYGVIYRPTNFDPARKYPVIEKIYAGPQSAYVPKEFFVHGEARELAELGFIVVQIDGMGTSQRSKAFHDLCWKNLVDAGLPDRILWLKAAAEKHPEMDLTRVGIYGGSAGGQNALGALLTHGDFYKVAVSDCGCHDNRMDKIWWNELWMGWPVGPEYAAQSNVTLAKNLRGKVLLIVGELDNNVDPASTMQVANALIKADKDFDLLIVPGAGHGAGDSPYGRRRTHDFFVRYLLGVEPRR